MRIQYDEMLLKLKSILIKNGFPEDEAHKSAKIFTDNSADGVCSHGVNRFPVVISYIKKGHIKIGEKAEKIAGIGGFEQWDGKSGMGNLNAVICMDRAISLSREFGIGVVALKNNNHWMRGGYYGWQAADAGCIAICWSNTDPGMPAWGAKDRRIGNNPFVIAIPRSNGEHVVLDMAMSQFSYGRVQTHRLKGEMLPVVGGYDTKGELTCDPVELEKTNRFLPIGFWKGSGMSIALDLVGAVMSGGYTVTEVKKNCGGDEYGLTQIFIVIDPSKLNVKSTSDAIINEVLEDIKASEPALEGVEVRYPGEQTIKIRRDSMKNGISVIDEVWKGICEL